MKNVAPKIHLLAKNKSFWLSLPLAALLLPPSLKATVIYWDPEGTTTQTAANLAGTWNTTSSQWAAASAQSATLTPWVSGDAACFVAQTGTVVTTAFTVTVSGTIPIGGLYNGALGPNGYNVTLGGSGSLAISGQAAFDTAGSNGDPTVINCNVSGTGQMIVEGSDQLYLNGTNTYTGGTQLGFSGNNLTSIVNYSNAASFGTGPISVWNSGPALVAEGTAAIVITNRLFFMNTATNYLFNVVAGTGGTTFSGNWDLTNTTSIGAGTAGNLMTISGVISGPAGSGVTKYNPGTLTLSGANTYSGKTTISAGILSVKSLNKVSGGSASSSLGAPTVATNGTISIGSTTTSATLIYTGTGESTDRIIDLAGTTGGAVIENDGTGPIAFTSANTASGAGSKYLTLQGSNTGTNTISGVIVNNGGTNLTSVLKAGAGTWILSAANTFSGNITNTSGGGLLGIGNANALGTGTYVQGGNSSIDNTSGASLTVTNNFNLSGGSPIFVGSANMTLSGLVTLSAANRTITVNANTLTLSQGIAGNFGLTKAGAGTLALMGNNLLTNLNITTGTLALGSAGSLANITNITIAAGATLDVSALTTFGFSTTNNLTASGTATAATLIGGTTVNLGAQKITLSSYDGVDPSLLVSSGNLILNSNAFVVNGSVLSAGAHTLIHVASGTTTLFGMATVTGTALGSNTGVISISGSDVILNVLLTPAFSALTTSQSIGYGTPTVTLGGTLSASGPIYPASGETVSVSINGNVQSTTVTDAFGGFSIVYNASSLPNIGAFPISYIYAGNNTSLTAATNSTTTLTITAAPLTVTATAQTKSYGEMVTVGAGNTNFTSSGLQYGQTIGSVTAASAGAVASAPVSGSPYGITVSAATGGTFIAGNYSIAYVTNTLTVTPASLTVTAASVSQVYGATNAIYTATYTGFTNSETLGTSDVAGSPVFTNTVATNSDVGNYTNTPLIGTLTSTNYSFAFAAGTITVTNALSTNSVVSSLSIAAPGTDVVFTSTVTTLAPSGAVPTNTVQFVIDGTNYGSPISLTNGVAITDSATLSHGVHTIEVDYAGDTNALGATNIVGSTNTTLVTIDAAPIAGTATYGRTNGSSLMIASTDLLAYATDPDGDALSLVSVSATSTNGASVSLSGGVVTYTPPSVNPNVVDSFTYTVADTYGSTGTGTVVVTNIALQPGFYIASGSQSISYGTSSISLTGTISSATAAPPAGETVNVTINGNTQPATIVGSTGYFSLTFTTALIPASGTPYTITYSYAGDSTFASAANSSTALTVTPAAVTVTANSASKGYGQTLTFGSGSTNFTSSGLQNGDTVGSVTLSSSGGVASAPVSGSPYAIVPSTATGGTFTGSNYSFAYVNGSLTVTPAALLVAGDSVSEAYGATNPVFTVTYSGFTNSETVGTSDVAGSPAFTNTVTTNSSVGVYTNTVLIGTLTSTNYTFVFTNGLITVTNALSTNVLVVSTNVALPGTDILFTTTITTLAPSMATATNTVQFVIDGTNYGASVPLTNGVATADSATLSHGNHTIEADYAGDTNEVGATDIVGSTNTASVLINTPPVAGTATYGRTNDTVLSIAVSNLLTYATDADGDTLSLVSVTPTSTNGATIALSGGVITYTQAATNGNVIDQFGYTVADTFGATNSGLVIVTNIVPFAGPPVNITGITTEANGTSLITFAGYPNQMYLIQSTTNLTPPITWATLTNIQADTNGMFQFNDLASTNYPTQFYRTKLP